MDDTQINSEAALDAALVWQRTERIRRLRRQVRQSVFFAMALPAVAIGLYFAGYMIDGDAPSLAAIGVMLANGALAYVAIIKRRELAAAQLESELKAQQALRSQAK